MVKLYIKKNKVYRNKSYLRIVNKQIQLYIKNECIGSLDLSNTRISKLPNNLKYIVGHLDIQNTKISELPSGLIIEGTLWCRNTPLSKKNTAEEIKSKWKIYGNVWN